jgi:Family of unknown function (DUF5977)
MKIKYIIAILFVLNLSKTNAQKILDISEYNGDVRVQGAYYKDTQNKLNAYLGNYVYTSGTTSLKFVFKKVLDKNGTLYTEDVIVGEYQYIVNGVEKANTLNRFNLYNADEVFRHSICGNNIFPATAYCSDCAPNEEHFYTYLSDDPSRSNAIFDVKKTTQNGKEAIRVLIGWSMREQKDTDPPLPNPSLPGGYYVLVKENFTNTAQSGIYRRNNCASTQTSSSVKYTVPAGKYSSAVSQADADAQAQADLAANGQKNANAQGTCTTATNGKVPVMQ